jgi:hypothetical protein
MTMKNSRSDRRYIGGAVAGTAGSTAPSKGALYSYIILYAVSIGVMSLVTYLTSENAHSTRGSINNIFIFIYL